MTRPNDISPRWLSGIWVFPMALAAIASYANFSDAGRPITVGRAVWLGVGAWIAWAALTPVVVRLGQRWPVDRRRHWRFVVGHVAAAVAIGVVAAFVAALAAYDATSGKTVAAFVGGRVATRAPMESILYFIILGVSYLAINTRRLHERELFAERVSRELSEAQLNALRMQMHPHFLFNSLSAVMTLVREQATERADRALVVLSDVLRMSLRDGTRPRVPLSEEVVFIRNYLEIETLRFGDRLTVCYDIPANVGDAQVPTFILQPLIENALQHGLMDLPDGGTVRIAAEKRDDTLALSVTDDGVGLSPGWEQRAGRAVGIKNARARLTHMYGASGSLSLTSGKGLIGTRAIVELPFEVVA